MERLPVEEPLRTAPELRPVLLPLRTAELELRPEVLLPLRTAELELRPEVLLPLRTADDELVVRLRTADDETAGLEVPEEVRRPSIRPVAALELLAEAIALLLPRRAEDDTILLPEALRPELLAIALA